MKKIVLMLVCCSAIIASAQDLVIATTLSSETTKYIVQQWQQENPKDNVRVINRTSSSLESLLEQENLENVDLIISSSPFLFSHLKEKGLLVPLPENLYKAIAIVPSILTPEVTAIGFSGFGIVFNKRLLKQKALPEPKNWQDLLNANYYDSLLMSSPSRSSTNHLMLEMLLQQKGWQQGWADFLALSANFSLISSRSFNVTDKIKMGLAMAGVSIDSYATTLLNDVNVGFHYFPNSVVSPTFIAIHKNSKNQQGALSFIQFALSEQGQQIISSPKVGKFSVLPLAQQKLFFTENLNYELVILRQHLLERLFDVAVTFRLKQVKDVWLLLNEKEKKLNTKFTDIRQRLTAIPVSEQDANDPQYLYKIKNDRNFLLEQEKQWTEFFQEQLNKAISLLSDK